MPNNRRTPDDNKVPCPRCQRDLSLLCSWTFRALWGYDEVRTYECPEHGPTFVGPQTAVDRGPGKAPDEGSDDGDRDSLVSAPRRPTPTFNADAIAVPEPDSD
jgi:hypothetical protein